MKRSKGVVSVLLALALLLALLPAVALPALAGAGAGPISYIGADGSEVNVTEIYWQVQSSDDDYGSITWSASYMYVVKPGEDVSYDRRVTIAGDVVLVLCDGATFTAKDGIELTEGNSLTVYGQSAGTGKLIASVTYSGAGIGATDRYTTGGTLNVYGGTVDATGASNGAGIGGSNDGTGGTVNVYGGKVKATGGNNGAGIGGGNFGAGGTVNIYGGEVEANGGEGSAGIGGGYGGKGGTVNIYGGTIIGRGSLNAAGIGGGFLGSVGTVNIYGGEVEAYGYGCGAGIGFGFAGAEGTVNLYGGKVKAYGGDHCPGIGGDDNGSSHVKIQIRDAEVTAEGGKGAFGYGSLTLADDLDVYAPKDAAQPLESGREAACRDSGSVHIVPFASYVDADGSLKKQYEYTLVAGATAALSDGWYVVDGEVAVSERINVTGDAKLILRDGAKLTAEKGIRLPANDKISLTVYGQRGGTGALTANGPGYCAGIGGNEGESGGMLTVNGGSVTASGGDFGAGVGGGDEGTGGTVTVNGGSLTAYGKNGSAGIGGGDYGSGGELTVTGGTVAATGSTRSAGDNATGQAAPGIGAGRPKVDGSAPRSSGSFKMTGGSVTATPGTPWSGAYGAQAIGVNLADADNNSAEYITLSGELKVSVNDTPVAPENRVGACRSSAAVELEVCKPHSFKNGSCEYCGKAEFRPAVTFHANYDGANPATDRQEMTYNTETALRWYSYSFTAPEGRNFDGWNTQPDGKGQAYAGDAKVTLTEDLALYAMWKTQTFDIFWLDDSGNLIETTTVEYGVKPTHADLTKAETAEYTYTFAGWTPEIAAATSNATYTATFTATKRSYEITWKNDDGSVIDTTTVEYGVRPTHANLTKAATAEHTYTFKGWTPEVTEVTGPATYTAVFEEALKSYQVTFHANDGTDAAAEQAMAYGTPTALKANAFTRNCFAFTGWNTKADGSGQGYADGAEVSLTGDLALYAQWKRVTVIVGVEAAEESGAAACKARISCAPGVQATVWAARYDANGRFLGAEQKTLTPDTETEFTVTRDGAKTVRFFVLNAAGAPLCKALAAPQ